MNWLSRFLCLIGCHDWREMNGTCRECGYDDPLWKNWKYLPNGGGDDDQD